MTRTLRRQDIRQRAVHLARSSSLLYILGHFLDIYTTYLLSPNLVRETNVMVTRYGFGWEYILTSALVTSLLMIVAQRWMWRTIAERLPLTRVSYRQCYRHLLIGSGGSSQSTGRDTAVGFLAGVLIITLYGIIAAKWLTVAWNLLVLGVGSEAGSVAIFTLLKNSIAACLGFVIFLVCPYRLHRALHNQGD